MLIALPQGERDFCVTVELACGSQALSLIGAILYSLAPIQVIQIPLYSFANAGFEGFFRGPAQFLFDFTGVYGVAPVVARAVVYSGDQVAVAFFLWAQFLENVA